MYKLLAYIPKNHLSFILGWLAHIRLPAPFSLWLVKWFANRYQVNTEEASLPLSDYPSIGDFFVRELKSGIRPTEEGICSPVDGRLRNFGKIEDGKLIQVKGKIYSLTDLLQDESQVTSFEGGLYFHFYLSPQDYHHVHIPETGTLNRAVYIPGMLWPVNDWSLHSISRLYSVNERVVSYLDTDIGKMAVIMVGATNVGKIDMSYDSFPSSDVRRLGIGRKLEHRNYEKPFYFQKGDLLGTFRMGSSVVLLLPPNIAETSETTDALLSRKIKYGENLGLRLVTGDSSL